MKAPSIVQLIEEFEQAVRAHQMRGAQPPEDWDAIDEELKDAKSALIKAALSHRIATANAA